jgi:hypothetical protein
MDFIIYFGRLYLYCVWYGLGPGGVLCSVSPRKFRGKKSKFLKKFLFFLKHCYHAINPKFNN